jgi:hypothetical protein
MLSGTFNPLNILLVDECFTSSAPYAGHAEQLFFTVLFSPSAEHQLYSKPQSVNTSRETSSGHVILLFTALLSSALCYSQIKKLDHMISI